MKNKNANTLVIFGAPDHEEQLARKIAEAAGCMVTTATFEGKPVHVGTAYKADGIEDIETPEKVQKIIFFECANDGAMGEYLAEYLDSESIPAWVCDHHNPGDPGYGKGPKDYWLGSSLGQLIMQLSGKGSALGGATWAAQVLNDVCVATIREIKMTAAGDHCPVDAYAGRCPGIDPKEFTEFRLLQKAEFNLGPAAEWEALDEEIHRLRQAISKAEDILRSSSTIDGICDLREYGMIPELPEAAMKTGQKYMAKIDETDRAGNPTGNKKIVLGGCCTPEDVENFKIWASSLGNRMGEPYGVPARGFAGVVVTEPYCPTCKGEYLPEYTVCPKCQTDYPEMG